MSLWYIMALYRRLSTVDFTKYMGHSKNLFNSTSTNVQYYPKAYAFQQRNSVPW